MQIKAKPTDFVVREHWMPSFSKGEHSIYLLVKQDWNTEDCLRWLSKSLKVHRKHIGYCGNKDRLALTEQYISIKGGPKSVKTPPEWWVAYLGTRNDQLHLGEHQRNFFTITIRDYKGALPIEKPVRNLFGAQRFGKNGKNAEIGFMLLAKKYKDAAQALGIACDTDAIGALRAVPRHTLLLYIHACQSSLWNEFAMQLPLVQTNVPMPGFAPSGEMELLKMLDEFLAKKNLSAESFINRSFQELSLEGGERMLLQDLRYFSASCNDDVLVMSFSLGKGSYATETIAQLL